MAVNAVMYLENRLLNIVCPSFPIDFLCSVFVRKQIYNFIIYHSFGQSNRRFAKSNTVRRHRRARRFRVGPESRAVVRGGRRLRRSVPARAVYSRKPCGGRSGGRCGKKGAARGRASLRRALRSYRRLSGFGAGFLPPLLSMNSRAGVIAPRSPSLRERTATVPLLGLLVADRRAYTAPSPSAPRGSYSRSFRCAGPPPSGGRRP